MGRKRKNVDPDRPLPQGLWLHGTQYRARRSPAHPYEYFGTDYADAMAGYAAWRRDKERRNTFAWLLDLFTLTVCPGRVKAKTMAQRTADDYRKDAQVLKDGLGKALLAQLEPKHFYAFKEARAQDAPSHVRNELACASAALSYAVEIGLLKTNPCLEVRRPTRHKRERLISDDEYLTVYARAIPSVRIAMTLALRTLALPDDVLAMGPRNIVRDGEARILRFQRGKTGVWVEVAVVGELAAIVDAHTASRVVYPTFVHREDGGTYTVDGIGAMFRRYCVGSKDRPHAIAVLDFGLRDLRAKGATDMYRAKVDLRHIQRLLGHKSVRTTEIYLKSLVPETVRPNEIPIVASVK